MMPPWMMAIDRVEKCVNAQLWQACAGRTIQMPKVNSEVFYFVQGHIEHVQSDIDLESLAKIPHKILCRVVEMKYLADHDSDEVYAKIRLTPISSDEPNPDEDDRTVSRMDSEEDKPDVVMKTLTMSDANNGTGFSVPKDCADKIFPSLDYNMVQPSQLIHPRDVHGKRWEIKHIHRGTPLRHLLTTGWSRFVTSKKLIGNDSVLLLKTKMGKLRVGIRRKTNLSDEWHPESFYARCCHERGGKPRQSLSRFIEKVTADSVTQAVNCAVNGQPFEVIYYPRKDAAEFVVKAERVKSALQGRWHPGMRVRMLHEKKNSLDTAWFNGTVSAVKVSNSSKWPDSPWKLLQVDWDVPFLHQDAKHVSPWLLKPAPPDLLQPSKKIKRQRCGKPQVVQQLPRTVIPEVVSQPRNNPSGHSAEISPAGMQGARHRQSDINLNSQSTILRPSVVSVGFPTPGPPKASANSLHSPNQQRADASFKALGYLIMAKNPEKGSGNDVTDKSSNNGRIELSSAEAWNSLQVRDKPEEVNSSSEPFGKTTAPETQITEGNSGHDAASPAQNGNDSSNGTADKPENCTHSSRPAVNRMRRLKRSLEESCR